MLFSCGEKEPEAAGSVETLMTEYSDSLSVIMSRNGRRSYHFTAPQLEGYTLAREPYREFRKGVKITTYQDDSLSSVDAVLTANYAIYYENQELWEAKGNVVVRKSDGKTLYTQQLFWNARTDKVYSNVDSKIVQNNGRDVFIGEGFESDEELNELRFRRLKGKMLVDTNELINDDSVSTERRERPAAAGTAPDGVVRGNGPEKPVARGSGTASPAKSVATPSRPAGKPNAVELSSGEKPEVKPVESVRATGMMRPDAASGPMQGAAQVTKRSVWQARPVAEQNNE